MFMIVIVAGLVFVIASQFVARSFALRWALGILLGGLLAYNILAFGVFGISTWLIENSIGGVAMVTLIGQTLGFIGGWFWSRGKK
ncbi:MAG TPA: hypothetical protein DIW23_00690 [Anaerolineae bacterium]|nr:hypothetical protein [Anaerolineae bacterium]